MTELSMLWLPILLSSIIVFVASSLIHMGPLWHKNDYGRLPDEDKVISALRPMAIPPGDYMMPRPTARAEMKSAEFTEKVRLGPNMILTVIPNGPWPMARNLILWFLYLVAVGTFSGYVVGRSLPAGTEYMTVFKMITVVAFIGYSVALWQMWIWYRRSGSTTVKATIDGLIYALLTAGTFGWLWPR